MWRTTRCVLRFLDQPNRRDGIRVLRASSATASTPGALNVLVVVYCTLVEP